MAGVGGVLDKLFRLLTPPSLQLRFRVAAPGSRDVRGERPEAVILHVLQGPGSCFGIKKKQK